MFRLSTSATLDCIKLASAYRNTSVRSVYVTREHNEFKKQDK